MTPDQSVTSILWTAQKEEKREKISGPYIREMVQTNREMNFRIIS